jgi:hypothetical protein
LLQACDTLANRGRDVRLQWIPAHRGIKGNEEIDKKAKEITKIIKLFNKASVRYLSAVFSLFKSASKKSWDSRWNGGKKERYIYRLISQPTLETRTLYADLPKGQSAVLAQLRTGKIEFNAFLHKRRVSTVFSSRCACDLDIIIIQYILLICFI